MDRLALPAIPRERPRPAERIDRHPDRRQLLTDAPSAAAPPARLRSGQATELAILMPATKLPLRHVRRAPRAPQRRHDLEHLQDHVLAGELYYHHVLGADRATATEWLEPRVLACVDDRHSAKA